MFWVLIQEMAAFVIMYPLRGRYGIWFCGEIGVIARYAEGDRCVCVCVCVITSQVPQSGLWLNYSATINGLRIHFSWFSLCSPSPLSYTSDSAPSFLTSSPPPSFALFTHFDPELSPTAVPSSPQSFSRSFSDLSLCLCFFQSCDCSHASDWKRWDSSVSCGGVGMKTLWLQDLWIYLSPLTHPLYRCWVTRRTIFFIFTSACFFFFSSSVALHLASSFHISFCLSLRYIPSRCQFPDGRTWVVSPLRQRRKSQSTWPVSEKWTSW